jgi:uncharacterized membrane protein YeaQ/YmgE (transglycosylase-associated protein family)
MKNLPLIISLISGAVGGNIAGRILKDKRFGVIGRSLAGITGGGIVGSAIGGWVGGSTANPIAALVSNIVGSTIGGGVLLLIIYPLQKRIADRIKSRRQARTRRP